MIKPIDNSEKKQTMFLFNFFVFSKHFLHANKTEYDWLRGVLLLDIAVR